MSVAGGPDTIQDGLVLSLDAADRNSYPGSGTTWIDLSGNTYNGTLTNGPTFNSGNGGSIVFDGVDDFVLINTPSNLQNQNFSVSTWLYLQTPASTLIDIIDYGHGTQGWVIQSENALTNRNYYLAYFDGSSFQPAGGFGTGLGVQLTNSVWQNLTYVKNGTSVIGYLNGVQSVSYTATNSTVVYSNSNMTIGKYTVNDLRFYAGRISTTLIYNRALTASEIAQNYNSTKTRFGL